MELRTYYGALHPDKNKVSKELLNNGEIKTNSEIQEIDGTIVRIRCIRYKNKVYFHHTENDEVVEIIEL